MSALTVPQPASVSTEQSVSLDWLDLDERYHGRTTPLGTAIGDLFESAVSPKLKYPKVRLMTADGQVVVLKRAGHKSKYAGQIHVTDGGPYLGNRYFGHIDRDGTLYESSAMTEAVRELLQRFAV